MTTLFAGFLLGALAAVCVFYFAGMLGSWHYVCRDRIVQRIARVIRLSAAQLDQGETVADMRSSMSDCEHIAGDVFDALYRSESED